MITQNKDKEDGKNKSRHDDSLVNVVTLSNKTEVIKYPKYMIKASKSEYVSKSYKSLIKNKVEEYLSDAQELQKKFEEYIVDTTTAYTMEEEADSERLFQHSTENSTSDYLSDVDQNNLDDSRSNIINKTNCYGQLFRYTLLQMPLTYFGRYLLRGFQK